MMKRLPPGLKGCFSLSSLFGTPSCFQGDQHFASNPQCGDATFHFSFLSVNLEVLAVQQMCHVRRPSVHWPKPVHNHATASAAGFMLSGWLVGWLGLPGQGSIVVHRATRTEIHLLIFLMSQIRRIYLLKLSKNYLLFIWQYFDCNVVLRLMFHHSVVYSQTMFTICLA